MAPGWIHKGRTERMRLLADPGDPGKKRLPDDMRNGPKTLFLGICILAVSCDGRPPADRMLETALRTGQTNYLDQYLRSGGDVNRAIQYLAGHPQRAPLIHVPIFTGQLDSLAFLLSKGANANSYDSSGYTPLLTAIGSVHDVSEERQIQIIKMLIKAGADPNLRESSRDAWTPLTLAAALGQSTIVSILLAAGADINAPSSFGQTPLHLAKNVAVARLLIAAGANLTNRTQSGETPSDSAYRERQYDVLELITNALMAPNGTKQIKAGQ